MNDLTPAELAALTAPTTEIRQSRWHAFWVTHDRDAFFFTLGFVAGIIALVSLFDVWLYVWN